LNHLKKIKRLYLLFIILFFSCNQNTKPALVKKDSCISCKTPTHLVSSSELSNLKVKDSSGNDNEKMILIKGGIFQMGSNDFEDAKPIHKVIVKSFWMDEHEVTNAQFAAFVKATQYITVAERALNPKDFPGVPKSSLVAGSAVFSPPKNKVLVNDPLQWWEYIAGANWKNPTGKNSIAHDNEPVVQVCYWDALAYAKWAGKRLPAEAEWEYAARAGKQNKNYYWGNEQKPNGKWVANIFQGNFPYHNTNEDGYAGIAPVKSFPPNAFGLYDMEGNVWEWCNDFYRPDYYKISSTDNPQGPKKSYDPDEPNAVKRVQRGGSFMCSDQYCARYKAGSRGKGEVSSASNNLGFRCVKDSK
jgi:formylglycine-generating enzyme